MNTNYAPKPGTVSELRRQAKYLRTIVKRSDEKHAVLQAERLAKAEKIENQIALAESLEDMEAAL